MAEPRRQTRSTGAWRGGQQTDTEFWSNQPDPVQIERGQADAIQLVRSTINPTPNEPTEVNTTGTSGVPPMLFVDDEGLEEQFLTEDGTSQNILDITANHVTTPVDTVPVQTNVQPQEEELDLQPSRGPREESLVNMIGQFLDENYEDVLRTSNINTNFSISASNRNLTGHPVLPLGWIVPDGTNRPLEEIKDKKISNSLSPGGGQAGAMIVSLQRLEPYYGTQFFLVDLEMGEVFAYIQQQWRQAGLYCSNQPFEVNDLVIKVERHGQVMWAELEAEQQTPLIDIRRSTQYAAPPVNIQQTVSAPNSQTTENEGTSERVKLRRQERDLNHSDYVLNCIHENRPLTLNDVARPVFVNHYYAGEAFIKATSKKLIKLDECDVSTENSVRNVQRQGTEHEYGEHSQNSRITRQQTGIEKGYVQQNVRDRDFCSDF